MLFFIYLVFKQLQNRKKFRAVALEKNTYHGPDAADAICADAV